MKGSELTSKLNQSLPKPNTLRSYTYLLCESRCKFDSCHMFMFDAATCSWNLLYKFT